MPTTRSVPFRDRRIFFALFSIGAGAIGLYASFKLLTEHLKTLVEPGYTPSCDFSVLVTCGPNMVSWQGSLFGFPNAILGIAAFMAPIIVGVAILAGARLATWFWLLYQLGLLGGFIFVCWLQYQSIYNLGTLCPWCMVVWIAMIPLWWVSLFSNMSRGHLGSSPTLTRFGSSLVQWAWVFIALNFVVVVAASQFRLNWLFTEFGIGSY